MINITRKEDCCGCSSCMNICKAGAIEMKADSQGFIYPEVNKEICINCGACESACPILNYSREQKFNQSAYLVQHKDSQILRESTSGGAFTGIASEIIRRGGVVFGAAYDKDFRVIHKCVSEYKDLKIFRNSKYVQSDPGRTFGEVKKFLRDKKFVCYSGTPCEIEGLLKFLGDYSESDYLLTVDVVCRAVPSPAVLKTYIDMQGGRVLDLRFRDKTRYGYLYSQFLLKREDARPICEGIETNIYLRAFYSGVCLRPSCYECRFKKRFRRSDITLWDCWDALKFCGKHSFNQNAGITRVLINSDKGRKFFDDILDTFIHEKISADLAVKYDAKEMTQSVKKDPERYNKFWLMFYNNPAGTLRKFFPVTFKTKAESLIRRIAWRTGLYELMRKLYKAVFGDRRR